MTPRRLDPALVQERLREIQLLLGDLVEVGEVDAERLRRDRPTRHVVERVLSQIVELAGSINTHIVASLLGRSPGSYADSFDEAARAGVLEWDLATALRSSAGMRNVLVHDYLKVDHSKVADAIPLALEQYSQYVRHVARWLRNCTADPS
ncbi:MAG: type VII toxin-antitoxin system HepT family RNase toxin [Pseudonocardiaceae bacterium]